MKYLILMFTLFVCAMSLKPPQVVVEKPLEFKAGPAWGDKPEWTKSLTEAINSSTLGEVKKPCKLLSTKDCAISLISIMAKYESDWKPDTEYKESFKDSKGNYVVSRGLLQISKESANQKAYGCGIVNEKDLNDPSVNLKCAVKILTYQANKSGTLIDGARGGCSAYWSVCRKSSKSYSKIMDYLGKL